MKEAINELVKQELSNANEKFPLFQSLHEGYAVMLEEVEEVSDEIETIKGKLDVAWHLIKANKYPWAAFGDIRKYSQLAIQELVQVMAM